MLDCFERLHPDHPFYSDSGYIFFARDVEAIDFNSGCGSLELQEIVVKLRDFQQPVIVEGFSALELIWAIKPGALEGHPEVKFAKHSWFIHNMFGHPLMQILALLGFTRAAIKVHDLTVPKPVRNR